MKTLAAIREETTANIISSIINLVCPQCGGRMMEYQCGGRCRRNWLEEWEWANLIRRNPDIVDAGRRTPAMP